MEASPNSLRSIDAAAAVQEKIDAFRHSGETQPWARAVAQRLAHGTPPDDVASFLAFNIQRQVQRRLGNDDLRQLYDAYASHGYAQVASALARKAHMDAVALISTTAGMKSPVNGTQQQQRQQQTGEKTSLTPKLGSSSPSPIHIDKSRTGRPRKHRAAQRRRKLGPSKSITTMMATQAERDKMKAIEAQIRASQLARFAMRSGTRKSLR